jgi:hypothetical protein
MQEILRLMQRLAAELAELPVRQLAIKSVAGTARSLAVLLVEPSAQRSPQITMDTAQSILAQPGIEITKRTSFMTSGMRPLPITHRRGFRRGICHRQGNAASGTPEHHLVTSCHREAAGNSGIMYPKVHGSCVGKAGFRL